MLALLEDVNMEAVFVFSDSGMIAWSSTSGAGSATPARPTWSLCFAAVRLLRPALE